MLEIAPGVYTAPRMTKGIRERVWSVLENWFAELRTGSIVMTWYENGHMGGQGVLTLGIPPVELYGLDGLYLCRREFQVTLDQ